MSFQAVQTKIAKKEGVGMNRAGAILASATRRASPAAKRANPNLKKVLMPKYPKGEEKAHQGVADFFESRKGM